jgi:hypothetical protein
VDVLEDPAFDGLEAGEGEGRVWGVEEDVGDVDGLGYFEELECVEMALGWGFVAGRGSNEGEGNVADGAAFEVLERAAPA